MDFGEFGFWILGPESQIQNPKSTIQTFLAKFFGFWILDRYVAILYVRPQRPIFWILAGILNFGFWKLGIQDFGFWGFWILDFGRRGFWMLDFGDFGDFGFWGFWILDFRDFGDFGFWILDHYVADLYVQSLDFGFWGFWILDFGDLGFWILDFGDFGFWILGPESQIQNPKSKIPNPNFFGRIFWILDRYVAILYVRPQRPIFWILAGILNFGFWKLGIQDFGFWGFWILDFGRRGFWMLDFGDFGFWILDFRDFGDFGFWIFGTLCSGSLCAKFGVWNLGILDFGDFGFWILGILDFGFWGSWDLDFGLGILDWQVVTKFWMLHKKRRLCTPNRVGGFRFVWHSLLLS